MPPGVNEVATAARHQKASHQPHFGETRQAITHSFRFSPPKSQSPATLRRHQALRHDGGTRGYDPVCRDTRGGTSSGWRMYGVSMYVLHDRREDATCCVYGTILFVGTHEEVRRRTWMKLRSSIQVRGSTSLVNEPRMEFFTYFL